VNLLELLFGFQGRITRLRYWLGYCTWIVIGVLVYFALKVLIVATDLGAATVMFWGMGLLVLVPFIVSSIAINLRRLHDRDKSGWWLLVFYLVPVALAVFAQAAVGSSPVSSVTKVAEYGTLALQFWMIVELGFLPGTRGGNQYGEDPRASQPA
jgi:uncharacterized membrane protein YhaH (DUF805 family)